MPESKLPHAKTKEWRSLVKEYIDSDIATRKKLAEKYHYVSGECFMNAMANRGVYLPEDVKHKAFAHDDPRYTVPAQFDYKLPPDSTWKEHLRVIREMDSLVAYHQRLPQEVSITFDTTLPIGIIESADWQLGQFGVDYEAFERDMDFIQKEPGTYINVGGDSIQNIIQASKVGSSHNQIPIAVQKGLCVLTLEKMMPKILTLKTGNHNYWDTLLTGEDWLGEKAKQLKIVYIKHGGRINYNVGKQTYSEFSIHQGRFNSAFNQTHSNKQYQRMYAPWARIVTIEHHHVSAVEQYQYDGKECVSIRPGTYAVYDDFAQQNGFFGAHVANPIVILFPDTDRLVAFKDMYEGVKYLRTVRREYKTN